ncbi:pentatricopeptide repeat (PPR) superfamily protein [Wolffia australiana]
MSLLRATSRGRTLSSVSSSVPFPFLPWPSLPNREPDHPQPTSSPSTEKNATTVIRVLTEQRSADLNAALEATGIVPSPELLSAVVHSSTLSAAATLSLYRWSNGRCPGVVPVIVNALGKARAFDDAWTVLLSNPPCEEPSFAALIRRYARARMPGAAIRTFEYADARNLFDVLIDSLCKEGHARSAEAYVAEKKKKDPLWSPSIVCYNIFLHGFLRSRRFRSAERLWRELQREETVRPTVVTFGTMIEGLCRANNPDRAVQILEVEMRTAGISPNEITCNPIVDALAEAGRFKEALAAVEKFPLYGISPNISTYNSLIKGFCKNGDVAGASKILKRMIKEGILPTTTTYNYLLKLFSREGKIEEGMNLYERMVRSGYAPDRLSYHLVVKMLCEGKRLGLAEMVMREMKGKGVASDLATGSMLVHLLCRLRRFEEAFMEFEGMVEKGVSPQYLTYRMLKWELGRLGRTEMAERLTRLMGSVRCSRKLPRSYRGAGKGRLTEEMEKKKAVLRKAQALAESLKLSKGGGLPESDVATARSLVGCIRWRVYAG